MSYPANDDLKAQLVQNGYTGQLNDALVAYLKNLYSLTGRSYNDLLYYHLRQQGYTGSLSERLRSWDGTLFTPLSLFSAGQVGAWYDFSDFSSMWQDSAGTIPVTAVGQRVGKILDKSGNGNHATQATDSLRPTLSQDSYGNYYISTSVSGWMQTAAFSFGSDKVLIAAGVAKPLDQTVSTGRSGTIVGFGAFTTQAGAFDLGYHDDGLLLYRSGSTAWGGQKTASVGGEPRVLIATYDTSGASHVTENANLLVDTQHGAIVTYGTSDTGSGNLGTYALKIGNGYSVLNGRIYQVVVRSGAFTADEIAVLGRYLANKTQDYNGVFPYSDTPTSFDDTSYQTQRTGYIETDPFASVSYTTSATHFSITANTLIADIFPIWNEIGIYVDGVYNQSAYFHDEGEFTRKVTLPAGSKTVTFVNGGQSNPAQNATGVQGTMLVSVSADAPITRATVTPTNRIVIYGDSIAIGANTHSLIKQGWTNLLSDAYHPNSVVVIGFGYRSLYMDAVDATARAAFVAKVVAANPARLWMAIGTNDYGINKWSAASFGTAYAALLDDLHTALPSLSIYCQTPLLRTTETANGSGSTLGDYRTQISTAVSTRTAYCTLVDGTTIMTTASLEDGVHPTIAGHVTYSNFVKTTLGIV